MAQQPAERSAHGDVSLARALALVRDLRARCPWDHAQTRDTLRPYLVDEALELDQALEHGEPAELRDELGDLLLHLAFQIVIGEEQGEFDAATVTRALEEKMWRRHPHLFGGSPTPDHEGWERVKKRERRAGSGTLRGLPPSLPPLLMAYRLQERAAGVGFDWPDAKGPMEKVKEEIGELERETLKDSLTVAGRGKRLKTKSAICSSPSSTSRASWRSTRARHSSGRTTSSGGGSRRWNSSPGSAGSRSAAPRSTSWTGCGTR